MFQSGIESLRDRSLFKCQGGRLKSRGGHMNFHVASRGSPLTLDSQQGGGGHV